ncbi:MAG: hypothetical protein ACRD0K_04115 [Egibacteraceae bacterium]
MPLRLDDIAVLDTGRPPGAGRIRRRGAVVLPGMARRSFLRAVWAASMGIGLAALGVFPAARRALAHEGHLIYPESTHDGPCAPDGYAVGDECSPGCSRTPCVNCCIEGEERVGGDIGDEEHDDEENGDQPDGFTDELTGEFGDLTDELELSDFVGYHRYDSVGSVQYSWRPNQCWGGSYDGWLWRCSPEISYRCHDGYVTTSDGGTVATVCRWEV